MSESVIGGYMCVYCDCLGTYDEQISDDGRYAAASENNAVFDFCQVRCLLIMYYVWKGRSMNWSVPLPPHRD